MKKIIITIIISTLAIISCQDKLWTKKDSVQEMEITLNLSATTNPEYEIPYSTKSLNINNDINNLNIFISNDTGDIIYSEYSNSGVLNPINCIVSSKQYYNIYAIANANKRIVANSVADLENMQYTIEKLSDLVDNDKSIVMTATISHLQLQNNQTINLKLRRCICKIGYKFDYSRLDDNITIDIKKVKLCNVPNKIHYFRDSKAESTNDIISIGDSREGRELGNLEQTHFLYSLENKQGSNLLPDNDHQIHKSFSESNPLSDLCTYLEVDAYYKLENISGDIIYRFYLGKDILSNFNLDRNTQYNNIISFVGKGGIDEVSWRVVVDDLTYQITKLTLFPPTMYFYSTKTTRPITAVVVPEYASNKNLTWTSSNPSVASVNNIGMVTSNSQGTTIIRASTNDGSNLSATCRVYVYKSGINIPSTQTMYKGEYRTIEVYSRNPNNPSQTTWSSSNDNIATVDSNGEVRALQTGRVTITASHNGTKANCAITIGDAYRGNLDNIALLVKDDYSDGISYPDITTQHQLTNYIAPNARVEYQTSIYKSSSPTNDLIITNDILTAKEYSDYRPYSTYKVTAKIYNNKDELIEEFQSNEIKIYYELNCYVVQEFERKDEHTDIHTYEVTTTFEQSIPTTYFPGITMHEYPIYENDTYQSDYSEYKNGTIIYTRPNIKVSNIEYIPNSKIESENIRVYFISNPPEDYLGLIN